MSRHVTTVLMLVGCAAAPIPTLPPVAPLPARVVAPPAAALEPALPAAPAPFDDDAILSAICGRDNVVPPPYAGCLRCPAFTTFATQGQARDPSDETRALFRLQQKWRGSFTAPQVEQVALTFNQGSCEPTEWGASRGTTFVMQRGATGPEIAHQYPAFGPEQCVAGVSRSGLTQLLCRVSQRRGGLDSGSDAVIVHDFTRPVDASLVELVSSVHSACDEEVERAAYANYVLRTFTWNDVNHDAHPDVTISIAYALFSGSKAARLRAACKAPNPRPRVNMMPEQIAQFFADKYLKDATLQFMGSESGWEPTPETRSLLDAFDAIPPQREKPTKRQP